MSGEPVQQHRYGAAGSRAARLLIVVVYLGLPVLVCLAGSLGLLVLRTLALLALPLLALGALPVAAALIASADITQEREGLRLHILGPWQVFIPWEATRHSSIWALQPPLILRLLLNPGDPVQAVYVPGLTILSIAGIVLGLGRTPVFVVTPRHDRHEQLIRRLEHMRHPLSKSGRDRPAAWHAPRRR